MPELKDKIISVDAATFKGNALAQLHLQNLWF